MTNMVELDEKIKSEINAIAKYSNREIVNIEALIIMVEGLWNNLQGQRPNKEKEMKCKDDKIRCGI